MDCRAEEQTDWLICDLLSRHGNKYKDMNSRSFCLAYFHLAFLLLVVGPRDVRCRIHIHDARY